MEFTAPISFSEFLAKADELLLRSNPFRAKVDTLPIEFAFKIKKYTYGTYSTLHRGFYCPSPVNDIFAGNQRRGREVKSSGKDNVRFRYGFSQEGLIQVETIQKGMITSTEYLVREGDERIGITFDSKHGLISIAQEKFYKDILKEYHIMYWNNSCEYPTQYFRERYAYDEQGLLACNYQAFLPIPIDSPARLLGSNSDHVLTNVYYSFGRCNGMLTSYTATYINEGCQPQMANNGNPYPVLKKRKA